MGLFDRAVAERPDPKLNLFFVREKQKNNTIIGKGIACAVRINEERFLVTSSNVTKSQGNNESSAYAEQCFKSKNPFKKKKKNVQVDHRCLNHSYFSLIQINFDPDENFQVYTQDSKPVFRPPSCRSLVVTRSGSYHTVQWEYKDDGYQIKKNDDDIVFEEASAAGSPVLWTNTTTNQCYVVGVIRRLEDGGFVPEIFTQETLQQLTGECIINLPLIRYLAKYIFPAYSAPDIFLMFNACLF